MAEVNINDAIDRLLSDRTKERSEGLADLKHILVRNRNNQSLDVLKDKGYHKIYEALFRAASIEKSIYIKATRPLVKSQSATRLSACAAVLRPAVEAGVRVLKQRTVRALIGHIIETLPLADGGFCEPLATDYPKTLRILLEYQPHVEHLPTEEWQRIAGFCEQSIRRPLEATAVGRIVPNIDSSSGSPWTLLSNGSSNGLTQSRSDEVTSRLSKTDAEEPILCLEQLLSASNAPVAEQAADLISSLISFLQASTAVSRVHQATFAALNLLLSRIATDQVDIPLQAIKQLLPLIRRFWDTRSAFFREEMLATLILHQTHIAKLLQIDADQQVRIEVEKLMDCLHDEYVKRNEREQLQLDDLIFLDSHNVPFAQPYIQPHGLALRINISRAQRAWAVLALSATLMSLLDAHSSSLDKPHPRGKRLRVGKQLEDCLRQARNADRLKRLFSLAVLSFRLGNNVSEESGPLDLLDVLKICSSDEDGSIASWALLATASYACKYPADRQSDLGQWLDICHLAARSASNPATSRAACHLLTTVLVWRRVTNQDMAQTIDTVLSPLDLNGPATITDTALSFWTVFLSLQNHHIAGKPSLLTERILQWFFSRWSPVNSTDRSRVTFLAQHARPTLVLDLFSVCAGKLPSTSRPPGPFLGHLAQAWIDHQDKCVLLRYLLLVESSHNDSDVVPLSLEQHEGRSNTGNAHEQVESLILNTLNVELGAAHERWVDHLATHASHINTDMVKALTSLCLIGQIFHSLCADAHVRRVQQLSRVTQDLLGDLVKIVRSTDSDQALVDAMLETLEPFCSSPETHDFQGLAGMANTLDVILENRRASLKDLGYSNSADPMDIDDHFDFSQGATVSQARSLDIPRQDSTARFSTTTFRQTTMAQLHLLGHRNSADAVTAEAGFLIDYLLSLQPSELLACRGFLPRAISQTTFTRPDAHRLLYHLGQEYLQSYEYDRCEVSLGICLEVMTALTDIWSQTVEDELSESSASMYHWFIDVALKRGIASPNGQIAIANLLHRLLQCRPDYAIDDESSSVRTNLLLVLRQGEISVKSHIADLLPAVFHLFVPNRHDSVFEDVLSSLPVDVDWIAGIAIRLLVLSRLASAFHTLLRRSVYHLFETAGVIPDLAIHASRCISDVTVALELGHTRNLLRLFLPQILHTWLETQALQAAPFSVFGYSSLKEMLQEIQQEAVAQLIMRAADDQIAALAATLDSTVEDVIEATFDRAIAYSIARDISLPPLEGAQPYVGGEMRMRKRFGKERFLALVNGQFARILAHLFRCIEQEDQIDRAFAKRPKFASAAARLRDIKALGSSDVSLPPNQQPSFRARYLLDEMDHLCQRTGHDPTRLWTPPLLTYVLRQLLDSMIPALGPLHACSVIRKLRLVVSLAGDVAAHDYPVEMLLHALRPYLTEPNCADDAMGLVQYLMQAGRIHLTGKPSFVAGLSLSVLASIRVFLSSSDAPQLLERQRRATKSRARQFHDWMTRFLDQYSSPQLSNDAAEVLNEIVHLASGISGRGNAKHGTSESGLLRALLREDDSAREILSGPSRSLALSLLCSQFEPPTRPGEDMYELDELAVAEGGSVWKSCQGRAVGKGYLLWIGRVLGRGYAASGIIPEDLLPEVQLHQSGQRPKTSSSSLLSDSNGVILSILRDTLLDESSATVSMAERTLQLVVSRLIDVDEMVQYETILPLSLLAAFRWQESAPPDLDLPYPTPKKLHVAASEWKGKSAHEWLRDVCIALARSASDEAVLGALPSILMGVSAMAQQLFPYVLHVVLLREYDSARTVRKEMSDILRHLFHSRDEATALHVKPMLLAILYLRSRPIPGEDTAADRESWLDLKYDEVADAAARCKMYKTALLFLEIHWSQTSFGSRRSSAMRTPEPTDLLLAIFRNIDDPDSFYGVQQPATLSSIVNRLDFEHDGLKSLAFCGARYDSQVLRNRTSSKGDTQGLISALGNLDLNGLSYTLLEGQRAFAVEGSPHNAYEIARKLEQWDLPVPAGHHSDEAVLYRAFQGINNTLDGQAAAAIIDGEVANTIGRMMDSSQTGSSIRSRLRTLAVLTEMTETLRSESPEGLRQTWQRMQQRRQWMDSGRFEDVSQILSARSTLFSSLQRREQLCTGMSSSPHAMRNFQIQALLDFSRMSRKHGYLQHSLTTATYLSDLIEPCQMEGLHVSAAVRFDVAQCLWDQGEVLASVQMLRDLSRSSELTNQAITVGKPELIARLGHHVAEARLEKPDEIISQYLLPAIKGLKGSAGGDEAGQVYHEFASFCDQQLQDTDNLEDYHRARRLRERKEAEVRELDRLCAAAGSQNKGPLQVHRNRAKSWFELDHREYQRLHDSRQAFIRQSLENYLLCLRACDSHENDALRFCALWLEQSGNDLANRAVSRYLSKVPSRKFAMLMNQLSSRLLDTRDEFQSLLRALVLRICVEHPYHSMYQIFLATKSRGKDETSMSRQSAASKVASQLRKQEAASRTWQAVHDSSICYAKFAMEKTDDKETYKPGARIPLKKMPAGHRLEQEVVANKLPPPTMTIPLRADCDYTGVPKTVRFHPEMTVAGGVSAPKIVTVIGSDGTKYKQLVKGGHDDLRQDAIMEQVFQQVSELLQHDRATRQRNLGIRTYRVLPLTTNTGVIEFVPNTIPLHDYLTPAHRAHYPNDWKPTVCRKNIGDVQSQAVEVRVKVFRQVTDHYHPVMRFFFMERFENPAEWFEKRLAYSRSTAAISILGHVLGLGDRHGHNILLDEKTGEVVHIDLGVAFDQGRVLPVPEVVPFRLTRDVVDGMGITKTEGVFRRCCEFTLEALRKEAYSIMTVLDVLRYDPLYSWTVSPLRAKRQLAQPEDEPGQPALEAEAAVTARKRESNEPSEADRALTVVTKKLSKTLSVTATVNELIQQATDERNLALLYGGWAAYS